MDCATAGVLCATRATLDAQMKTVRSATDTEWNVIAEQVGAHAKLSALNLDLIDV